MIGPVLASVTSCQIPPKICPQTYGRKPDRVSFSGKAPDSALDDGPRSRLAGFSTRTSSSARSPAAAPPISTANESHSPVWRPTSRPFTKIVQW